MLHDMALEDRRKRARLAKTQTNRQRQMAIEEATFSGALLDVSEGRLNVAIQMENDQVHRGVLDLATSEFIEVNAEDKPTVLIAIQAITGLEVTGIPNRRVTPSSRALPDQPTFVSRLTAASEVVPSVRVVMRGSKDPFSGKLLSVGADVIGIGPEPNAAAVTFLPVSRIAEVKLLA